MPAPCEFSCASNPALDSSGRISGGFESPLRHLKRPSDNRRALPEAAGWLDDLGRRIPRTILSYNEERLRAKGRKPVPVPVQDQILRGVIILSIVGLSALLWRYVLPPGAATGDVLHVILFCLNLGVLGHFVIDFLRRRSPSVQIPKRLNRRECPGCLYDLAGLQAERIETIDLAIRCPECGAVWRSERVGKLARSGNKKPRGGPGA